MNCEVCQKGVGVAKCKRCGKTICKNCGRFCPNCKSAVCISHLVKLENGKWMCELCVGTHGRFSQQAQRVTTQSSQPPQIKESLSFEDLTKEIGEVKLKIPVDGEDTIESSQKIDEGKPNLTPIEESREVINPFQEDVVFPKRGIREAPAPKQEQGYKHLRRKPSDDPNEFRILTASAPKPTPMWVSGITSGILAFVLSIPLIKNTTFPMFPQLFAYSVLLLAGGTIIWNGYGLLFDNNTKVNRLLCIPGLVLGIITAVIALMFGLR